MEGLADDPTVGPAPLKRADVFEGFHNLRLNLHHLAVLGKFPPLKLFQKPESGSSSSSPNVLFIKVIISVFQFEGS